MTMMMLSSAMFFLLLTKYSFVLTFTPVTGVARAGFGATHHHRLYASSTAQEDFSNDIGYWKGQVEGLKTAVEGFKMAAQIAEMALARSDKAVEIAESSRKVSREDLQDLISNLKIQLLQAKGTMTCRGLLQEATRDVIHENGSKSTNVDVRCFCRNWMYLTPKVGTRPKKTSDNVLLLFYLLGIPVLKTGTL